MPKYQLTELQKTRLCSIVDGLKEGYVKSEWVVAYGGDALIGIFGLDDKGELWRNVWIGVTFADFADYVDCGFFRNAGYDNYGQPTRYTLKKQSIIVACENDFELPATEQLLTTNIHGNQINTGNITAESVAIGSNATAIVQKYGTSGTELVDLFKIIYKQIETRPINPDVDNDEIAQNVKLIEQELTKAEPNNNKIERWLTFLATMVPDIFETISATLIDPAYGVGTIIRKVVAKAQRTESDE